MGLSLKTFSTLAEAEAAVKAQAAARYLGGGTLVVRDANEGDISFSTYVRSTDSALSELSVGAGKVRIGSAVTMSTIARHPGLAFLAPAAKAVGGPAIRNMATVGGNLFAPTPYGDFGVALLALDASVEIGSGSVPIADFFAARDGALASSLVKSVSFDLPRDGGFRFMKAARVKPKGVSVVTIAAVIEEQNGVMTTARVAYGCMADRPMRAQAVEAALIGKPRTRDGIASALAVATEGTSPVTDAIASAWYRAEVLPVHLGRLLLG
jgi:CO/xanthine dehydrogenase FAD-binding subunit